MRLHSTPAARARLLAKAAGSSPGKGGVRIMAATNVLCHLSKSSAVGRDGGQRVSLNSKGALTARFKSLILRSCPTAAPFGPDTFPKYADHMALRVCLMHKAMLFEFCTQCPKHAHGLTERPLGWEIAIDVCTVRHHDLPAVVFYVEVPNVPEICLDVP